MLGPEPNAEQALFEPDSNTSSRLSIPEALVRIGEWKEQKGQIVEILASEPEEMEQLVELLVTLNNGKIIAILGGEKAHWVEHPKAAQVVLMPSQKALQIIFATQELLQSKSVDFIVIQEILLKSDALAEGPNRIIDELRKLKKLAILSNSLVVLINPDTPERKFMASELQFICSHQLKLMRYEGGKVL